MTPNTTTHTANLGRGEKYQLSLGIQCKQTLLRRRFAAEAIIQRCHKHTKKQKWLSSHPGFIHN